MRAFSYWMVLDLYRKGPKVDENTPVTGFIPEAYDGPGLFDFIESELKELVTESSASSLPDSNEYGRASKPTAWALLARLYLNSAVYRGTVDTKYYTECITACHRWFQIPPIILNLIMPNSSMRIIISVLMRYCSQWCVMQQHL